MRPEIAEQLLAILVEYLLEAVVLHASRRLYSGNPRREKFARIADIARMNDTPRPWNRMIAASIDSSRMR